MNYLGLPSRVRLLQQAPSTASCNDPPRFGRVRPHPLDGQLARQPQWITHQTPRLDPVYGVRLPLRDINSSPARATQPLPGLRTAGSRIVASVASFRSTSILGLNLTIQMPPGTRHRAIRALPSSRRSPTARRDTRYSPAATARRHFESGLQTPGRHPLWGRRPRLV